MEAYIEENGFSNMTATQPIDSMLRDLQIVSQSSMIALDADGVITFRKGYGGRGANFESEFSQLVQ